MTVEQSSLHQRPTQSREEAAFAKIKEITGIDDVRVIKEAIVACCNQEGKYNIEDVVAMLIQDPSVHRTQASPSLSQTSSSLSPSVSTPEASAKPAPPATSSSSKSQVIDLTNESPDNEDIQKAIVASLQDTTGILGGQVTREEQDISRVLEASLAESKVGTKRKRGDLWFVDPLNPHERKRQNWWPVGLKNVGNTCWFSAVIQERRNLRFMQELRHLFALMSGTHRKYVDPSKAVEILKEAFTSPTGVGDSQQDVSEFQHKLLEWLEDAFRCETSKPPSPEDQVKSLADQGNPMIELFYGQYKAEGINEGKVFMNKDTFGQFPLQVTGFRDIHESLEAATAQGEIESVNSDVTHKSKQELWFTRLPPVLTFELSRFQFNQHLGRPEKIHNKLDFPQVIYMDRYMECNKLETRQRREEAKKLKEELLVLQRSLDKFVNYGSGSKRFPLQDVLLYALEFAASESSLRTREFQENDVEMESPRPLSKSGDESLVSQPPDVTLVSTPKSPPKSPKCAVAISCPSPRHITDSELHVLQDCLHRWRTEVENDVRELQENISILEERINRMYNDESMKKYPYHLHAVLVHEGQAASGHYWAYVFDYSKQKWLKFNDITVTEASWEELEKESVGGYHNASAYCLMYIDESRKDLHSDVNDTESGKENILSELPTYLKGFVYEDNKKFAIEIEEWDREQAKKAATGETDVSEISEPKTSQSVSTQTHHPLPSSLQQQKSIKHALSLSHAQLSFQDTIQAVTRAMESEIFKSKGPEAAFFRAADDEMIRLENLAYKLPQCLPKNDPRLQHIVVYLCANNAPTCVKQRMLLEQFSNLAILDRDTRAKEVRLVAEKHQEELQRQDGEPGNRQYLEWHERYHRFRSSVYLFIKGIEVFHNEKFREALPYFRHSYAINKHLERCCNSKNGGLYSRLLAVYRRYCMLRLNEMAAAQFETESDVTETLRMMNELVLPCLPQLFQSGYKADTGAAEEMREKWCTFLGQDLESHKVEKLQDFLSKLFEPATDVKPLTSVSIRPEDMTNLHDSYMQAIELSDKHGFLSVAKDTS